MIVFDAACYYYKVCIYIITQKVNSCLTYNILDMSVYDSLFEQVEGYMCKICGHTFSTARSLAAHIDSEHPEAEQPEIF